MDQLIRRGVESRYKGSVLGLAWSFVQPLMMLCVYTFVFSIVFRAKFGDIANDNRMVFAVIMFTGMTVFNLFSESVLSACSLITGNTSFVKKVIFPLEILVPARVITAGIMTIPWLALAFIGNILGGPVFHISWPMLLLPLMIVPLLLLSCGAAYFLASLAVYLKDLEHFVGVVTQILFFMSPIFYSTQTVPEQFRIILLCNPLTPIIENTRMVFLYGTMPDWITFGITLLVSAVIYQLGFFWFCKTKKGFADVL